MLKGHVVLNSEVIHRNGCFTRTRYWIEGHHNLTLSGASVRYITGYTGKETEVTIDRITPTVTFEVAHAMRVAA